MPVNSATSDTFKILRPDVTVRKDSSGERSRACSVFVGPVFIFHGKLRRFFSRIVSGLVPAGRCVFSWAHLHGFFPNAVNHQAPKTPKIMKKPITRLALATLCLGALVVISTGCNITSELKGKVVYHKSTCFGFRVTTSAPNSPTPNIELGLLRDEYLSIPTGTNVVYAAPFGTVVRADLSAAHQNADENISTLPTNPPAFYQVITNGVN